MGIKIPAATRPEDLANPAFMGKILNAARTTVTDGTVTNASFASRSGNSVIGRAQSTAGSPADISLATNQFLANRAGTLVGTTILDSDIPESIARDDEVTSAVSDHNSDLSAHAGLSELAQYVISAQLFS